MSRPCFLIALCAALVSAGPATGQPSIYVSPVATAVDAVGNSFSVEVRIEDYVDVRGFSIVVFYNQAAVTHTSVVQGNVFTAGGGPGGIFLQSGSIAAQGYILADGARIGGGGSTGDDARLFTINFESVGPGATDIFFGQILLRDSANQPLSFSTADGVVAVVSPIPDVSHTRIYDPDDADADFVTMGGTGLDVLVSQAGSAPRGKLTAARFHAEPPGGSGGPFTDPDGQIAYLGVTGTYWEITSSLAGAFDVDLGFSFARLPGPTDPRLFRVATRELSADAGQEWFVVPVALTTVDVDAQMVRIQGPVGSYGSGQYALVYDFPISAEPGATLAGAVLEAFPNPFSDRVTIRFGVPAGADVRLTAHDLLGRQVATLIDDARPAGEHETEWSPKRLPAGVYLLRLQAGPEFVTRRIVRLR